VRHSLTRRQKEVLELIKERIDESGIAPSLTELAADLGISRSVVQKHVDALVERGWLSRLAGRSRSLTPTD
jgi:repressor LexA